MMFLIVGCKYVYHIALHRATDPGKQLPQQSMVYMKVYWVSVLPIYVDI